MRFFSLFPKWKHCSHLIIARASHWNRLWCYFLSKKPYSICYETAFSTGISYGQTTSGTEALHHAYHINQSLGDTDEQKLHDSSMAISKCLVQVTSQNHDLYSKNTSTTETGKYLKRKAYFFAIMWSELLISLILNVS